MKELGAVILMVITVVLLIFLLLWIHEVTPVCSRAGNIQTAGDVIDCMSTRTAEARNK